MPTLLQGLRDRVSGLALERGAASQRSITTLEDWAAAMNDAVYGMPGPLQPYSTTWTQEPAERVAHSMEAYARQLYQSNGLAFAVIGVRMQAFSLVRFQWQAMRGGRPGRLFGTAALDVLERPYPGGSTQDLLRRAIQDVDLCGNAYHCRVGPDIIRLRPDWVQIVLQRIPGPNGGFVGWRKLGYSYHEGGIEVCPPDEIAVFTADEVAHWAPVPDPLANYRGMSWLQPIVRELLNDKAVGRHTTKFFENAAPLSVRSKILTPHGWTTMGSLLIGSEVIGSDGKPHRVTGVFPQGEQDMYRVRFADGSAVECTWDHVWSVQSDYDRRRGVLRDMTTEQIAAETHYPSGPAKWAIPFVEPVQFDDPGPLPVDPYLLGLLLGDGSFRPNGVSLSADIRDADAVAAELAARLPRGCAAARRDRGGWAEFYVRAGGSGAPNPFTRACRALGLLGVTGADKAVPDPYLRGSVSDRVALLAGLLDSDGSVDARQPNLVRFTNRSEALARAVADLARSLGGTSRIAWSESKQQWTVRVQRLPEGIVPFRLPRKAQRYAPPAGRGQRHRFIVAVEHVGREQAQCIRVDTPDHLFVTDDYVLTHNTPNLAVSVAKEISPDDFARFKELMDAEHVGIDNAYATLYLGGGADVKVIGSNLAQLDFSQLQGGGETRVAAAGFVPAVIVGLREGLNSATYSNYGQAMRRFGDLTLASLWEDFAQSIAQILPSPGRDVRLWYDTRHVAFLREDAKARAEVMAMKASIINVYITAGFTPESSVAACEAEDETLLVHTGMVSVQLLPPGEAGASDAAPASDEPASDEPAPAAAGGGRAEPVDAELVPVDATDRALLDADPMVRQVPARDYHAAALAAIEANHTPPPAAVVATNGAGHDTTG